MFIYGKNPVIESVRNNRIIKVYIYKNFKDKKILSLLKEKNIIYQFCDINKLFYLVKTQKHQGIVAEIKPYKYYNLNDLINEGSKQKNPIIIMIDKIEDPHNFGAIIRICDVFNVVGIIIREKNQVQLNATVAKVSCGAINFVKVARVSNLNNTIIKLKKVGYFIVSADHRGNENYIKLKYNFPIVLVIGGENSGVSKLVKKNSDFLVKIPMFGHVNSLNASNALSVVLSFIVVCNRTT